LGNPRAKTKSSLIRKFVLSLSSEIQIQFLAAAFFQIAFESGFQSASFQVLVSSLNKLLFISKVSGRFCRVAEIGFKVFSLGFSQLWF